MLYIEIVVVWREEEAERLSTFLLPSFGGRPTPSFRLAPFPTTTTDSKKLMPPPTITSEAQEIAETLPDTLFDSETCRDRG